MSPHFCHILALQGLRKGGKPDRDHSRGAESHSCLSCFSAAPCMVLWASVPSLHCKTFPLCSELCLCALCSQWRQAGCRQPHLPTVVLPCQQQAGGEHEAAAEPQHVVPRFWSWMGGLDLHPDPLGLGALTYACLVPGRRCCLYGWSSPATLAQVGRPLGGEPPSSLCSSPGSDTRQSTLCT